ncbi:hypothetical protein PHYBLDRAFT_160978 [Phycomyces blakesleeanus NRRL 1555(-)]|uniref:Uncharacterized protein n=1 Tax=Phycomyces blakesleeanus (strain ATCC 8743b / DSM 1359 / FGSC 10004 / NBRC 33097 / NRRL 1555) TaxID=763407 RepID=A0A167QV50_PHYB8|nr:hypothetical protein PHYBLDRAFT_160978 [Phycomyces blakesleeanus NRRL 1555(-)]OAD80329.1 hypothetical protein PHYBLDRAFT_160978 [Phycomyces blakesleeanus NRRL 1555(-)]|eukprot:XP_018298369.1 hypothetical protein PHYBLDRAFT_160978 [Phycomyces blakesleeanus NRRL 1555(-)]
MYPARIEPDSLHQQTVTVTSDHKLSKSGFAVIIGQIFAEQASKFEVHGHKLFHKNLVSPIVQKLLHEGIVKEVIKRVHKEGHYGVNNIYSQLCLQYTGPCLFETDFVQGNPVEEIACHTKVIQHMIDELRPEARNCANEKKQKYKAQYDLQVFPRRRFSPGKQVLMRNQKPPHKFLDRWLGPMTVTHVNNNGTYHLTGPNYCCLQGAVNGDFLIPFNNHKLMVPDVQVKHVDH